MSGSYSASFSARLLLIIVGLVVVLGGILCVLPASALRYVGIYYAVIGVFNLFILPLLHLLRHSQLELPQLQATKLAGAGHSAAWAGELG